MTVPKRTVKKLKQKDLPEYRVQRAEQQGGMCPLCGRGWQDAVLDHCHTTGKVRNVLCRLCNSLEGKIENWIKRYGRGVQRELFLFNLIKYWEEDYSKNLIHPKHRTEEEKEIAKLSKRLKAAKKESTKLRLRAEIQRLKEKKNG